MRRYKLCITAPRYYKSAYNSKMSYRKTPLTSVKNLDSYITASQRGKRTPYKWAWNSYLCLLPTCLIHEGLKIYGVGFSLQGIFCDPQTAVKRHISAPKVILHQLYHNDSSKVILIPQKYPLYSKTPSDLQSHLHDSAATCLGFLQ